ncbi:MAG: hypothetical protein OWU32_05355 [Firmicutes bacterium]|nr:hypothetical protein [Bacillota bacterium]
MERVDEHVQRRTLKEVVIVPDHARRTESSAFRASKERLRADGHERCWVCGATDSLQVHHFGMEWSLAHVADWGQVKAFVEEWDPYGYGRLLRNQPMESPDDVRNLLVLCERHHIGVDHEDGGSGTGIHELTFPIWVVQRLGMAGADVVPQGGETLEKAEWSVQSAEGSLEAGLVSSAESSPFLRDHAVPEDSDKQRAGGEVS